jgi:hypothetical protein
MAASSSLDPNLDQPIIRDTTRLRFPPADGNSDGQDCVDLLIRRGHPLGHLAPSVQALPPETGQVPWSRVSWPWASNGMQAAGRPRGRWLSIEPHTGSD